MLQEESRLNGEEYRNSARIMGDIIPNIEPRITDDYIFGRIKELIRSEKVIDNSQ